MIQKNNTVQGGYSQLELKTAVTTRLAYAPTSKIYACAFLGFWQGVAKNTWKQHLLDAEMLEVAAVKSIRSSQWIEP